MLKQRLVVLIVLAVLASSCAAGMAFRRGQEAARAGDWDAAVAHYTRALQEDPDNAQYKIELERATRAVVEVGHGDGLVASRREPSAPCTHLPTDIVR